MSIIFHCEHCGKKIEAPDNAGGKWGKCPRCHNKLYVPDIKPDDEELKLAPVDEQEEKRRKQLMAETYKLSQDILLERDAPNGRTAASMPESEMDDKRLTKNIVAYLHQTAEGNIAEAEKLLHQITPYGRKAVKIIDGIALSDMPEPELAHISPQVLSGLIRTLRTKIS